MSNDRPKKVDLKNRSDEIEALARELFIHNVDFTASDAWDFATNFYEERDERLKG
jgi:hypothetical protein